MSFFRMAHIVMKNLFRRPVTRRYPSVLREYPRAARGMVVIDLQGCVFCGLCQRKCPSRAISVSREQKSWQIDRMRCIVCSSCVENCPKKCLAMEAAHAAPAAIKPRRLFQDA